MLGGARRVSMAQLLKRAGERIGYDVEIFSYELTEQVPIALEAKVLIGLKWNDADVVDDIVRLCIQNEINILLPFVDGAIEVASKCRLKMPTLFTPVSEPEVAKKMFDKVEAAKVFEEKNIPIPVTYSIVSAQLPVIAKPRHGSASRGIKVFHNMDDFMHLENISDYLLQEYIQKREEYTVDCYVDQQGGILVTVPRRRLEVMGGEVTRTITERNPVLEEMSRKVIKELDLRGAVTLQFIHDLNRGRFLLMEVNPRLGGGVVCSIFAGAPIPDYIIKEALGIDIQPCDDWSDATLMARYQKEAIFFGNESHPSKN